jgi:hypothetical protein
MAVEINVIFDICELVLKRHGSAPTRLHASILVALESATEMQPYYQNTPDVRDLLTDLMMYLANGSEVEYYAGIHSNNEAHDRISACRVLHSS